MLDEKPISDGLARAMHDVLERLKPSQDVEAKILDCAADSFWAEVGGKTMTYPEYLERAKATLPEAVASQLIRWKPQNNNRLVVEGIYFRLGTTNTTRMLGRDPIKIGLSPDLPDVKSNCPV